MKPNHFKTAFIIAMVSVSAVLFCLQYFTFRDSRDTFFYLMQDLAFLPMQVLLVSLVLERFMQIMEKRERLEKQNMVIGLFFSEVGVGLLKFFSAADRNIDSIRKSLVITGAWSDKDFSNLAQRLSSYETGVAAEKIDFVALKHRFASQRGFLLSLMENQNLLEHERFTDLLWAVFHLVEELLYRDDFASLPLSDLNHLAGDAKRAYQLLIVQWVQYLRHLKDAYPYLYSLALRTNPFDLNAKVHLSA